MIGSTWDGSMDRGTDVQLTTKIFVKRTMQCIHTRKLPSPLYTCMTVPTAVLVGICWHGSVGGGGGYIMY